MEESEPKPHLRKVPSQCGCTGCYFFEEILYCNRLTGSMSCIKEASSTGIDEYFIWKNINVGETS